MTPPSESDSAPKRIRIPCALGGLTLNFWAEYRAPEGLVILDINGAQIVTIGLDQEGYFVVPWGVDITPPKGVRYTNSPRHGGCLAPLVEVGR